MSDELFGAVKLTKNVDTSHYGYSGYGICFDYGKFTIVNITNCKNLIIFGDDNSSSIHSTNKTHNIYVLGKDFIQGINGTTTYAEQIYKTNFTEHSKKFVLSLHYNGDNSYSFVNGTQELKFKSFANHLDINLLCVGNISSDWSLTNGTKAGLYGNVYNFAVDYTPINSVDIHRNLMKKHSI